MYNSIRLSWRHWGVAALLVGVLAGVWPAAAQAAMRGCRADPVFILSDGTVLDVQVAIGTDVGNVSEIHYVVHGPRGTKLVTALATPTLGFRGLETVSYVADQAPRQYVTDTLVHARGDNVTATSYTTFAGNSLDLLRLQLGLSVQYKVAAGYAGQHLLAYLSK